MISRHACACADQRAIHAAIRQALPLAPAGSLVQGTQRLSGALRTANPTGRRLFQAASGLYAQASALASFAPLDKNTTEASPPPPATVFGGW